ncbi:MULTISPECIES: hypothetical protein [unclassified Streptomyces]
MNKIKRWMLVLTAAVAVTAALSTAELAATGAHEGRTVPLSAAAGDTGWG